MNTCLNILEKTTQLDDLITEFITDSISDERKDLLFSLVRQHPECRKQFDEAVKLKGLIHVQSFENQKYLQYANLKSRLHFVQKAGRSRRWLSVFKYVAAAIALIIFVSLGSVLTYKKVSEPKAMAMNETTVPYGSSVKIQLPDGTSVVLNSGSIIKYPQAFGKKERNVYLVGEGYFEVAKDESKPFQVFAGDMKVKVTGTKFNLRHYMNDDITEVDLMEGSVDVSVGERLINLSPNEKAVYNRKDRSFFKEGSQARKASAWTENRLSFVNNSLIEILKAIERKYNVTIRVESPKASLEYFSGSIDMGMTLDEVFDFIDVDDKYTFEPHGKNVYILKDK